MHIASATLTACCTAPAGSFQHHTQTKGSRTTSTALRQYRQYKQYNHKCKFSSTALSGLEAMPRVTPYALQLDATLPL